jgi:hypothetical protein
MVLRRLCLHDERVSSQRRLLHSFKCRPICYSYKNGQTMTFVSSCHDKDHVFVIYFTNSFDSLSVTQGHPEI